MTDTEQKAAEQDDELEEFFNTQVASIEAAAKKEAKDKKEAEKKPPKKVEVSENDRILYDLLGAYAGKRAAQAMDRGVSRPPTPTAAPSVLAAPPVQPTMPPAPGAQPPAMARPVAGGPAGPVGGPVSPLNQMGGSGTYNYGKAFGLTDIEAGRALDMTKNPGGVNDLTAQRRQALQKIQQMGGGYAENPRYGGIMTPEQGVGKGPKESFAQKPAVPPSPDMPGGRPAGLAQLPPPQPVSAIPPAPPAPPKPGALSAALSGGKAFLGSPVVSGALGGLGAAESGQEFMKRRAEGDVPGQFMAGMGVAGGMAAMAPNPLVKILGGALSAASPLSLYLYDKIKNPPLPKPRVPDPGTNLPPVEAYRQ
jgi:hypothetical protein